MRLSDLQTKNLVNINNGKNIGNIIDMKIDSYTGEIKSLLIDNNKNILSVFNKDTELEINWKNIKKIGEDVILVDIK